MDALLSVGPASLLHELEREEHTGERHAYVVSHLEHVYSYIHDCTKL